jgi:hypothetical protein
MSIEKANVDDFGYDGQVSLSTVKQEEFFQDLLEHFKSHSELKEVLKSNKKLVGVRISKIGENKIDDSDIFIDFYFLENSISKNVIVKNVSINFIELFNNHLRFFEMLFWINHQNNDIDGFDEI